MENNEIVNENFISGVWSEKVLIITDDFEITGFVFMPKIGKRSRILSDILNGKRRFIAVKDCELKKRNVPTDPTEKHDFIQVNLDSIIILRPQR